MSSPVRFAILGAGIFVKEEHLPAVLASPNSELKAIYSRSIKSVKAVLEGATISSKVDTYSDDSGSGKGLDDLLARKDIDAVIVALPIPIQPTIIKKSLDAGKHVLSEKPIAKDIAAAKELISYAKGVKTGALWGVAENFRYYPTWTKAVEYREKLGKPLSFRLQMGGFVKPGDKYYETSWRKVPDYQGGFLLDGGVHFIAGLRKLLGDNKITTVSAFSRLNYDYLAPVDTVNGVGVTEDGTTGTITMSFADIKGGYDNTVQYQNGYVSVTPSKAEIVIDGKQVDSVEYTGNGVHEEVDAFAKGIHAGKLDAAQAPEEALSDLQIVEELLESAKAGGAPRKL
ncbi:hypothetical protein AWJ20_580 [Sugiyamaella lignohabitans]|uniref:NAD(P)-binding protein n=1 Tax=Sugiyamaella lignohabitans TaxID=796027 RepID=A0A167D0I2_9ASCO|nr:uncharacterized protein AWJ20_580 [Sugiyamaella lignohabitans]ANB12330.1 hypothetical protein AWJ20_580 [Sugiyamaella lignohabitans]